MKQNDVDNIFQIFGFSLLLAESRILSLKPKLKLSLLRSGGAQFQMCRGFGRLSFHLHYHFISLWSRRELYWNECKYYTTKMLHLIYFLLPHLHTLATNLGKLSKIKTTKHMAFSICWLVGVHKGKK